MESISFFVAYAHEDEKLLEQLQKHLSPLIRSGLINVWYDRAISAGEDWQQEIKLRLDTANFILLLISPHFMHSEYCYSVEMKHAIERHERNEARVIPIILRPVYWHDSPFGKLQALPKDAKPITSWRNRDDAFLDIAYQLIQAIDNARRLTKVFENLKVPSVPLQSLEELLRQEEGKVLLSEFMHKVAHALELGETYEETQDESILEAEIEAWPSILLEAVFKLTPPDFQALTYGRAGQSFFNRYHNKKRLEDLEMTRKLFNDGLQHVTDASLHATLHHSLGDVLTNLYRYRGKLEDLEESIAYYRNALTYIGSDDTKWNAYMDDLGTALRDQYKHTGNLLSLDESIKTHRQVLNVAIVSSSNPSQYFNHLGLALSYRYHHIEQLEDLQEAVKSFEQAMQHVPQKSRPGYLSNLGNALSTRGKHLNEISDLERAIQLQKEAVHLAPQGAYFQVNLGIALRDYYDRTGRLEALNESIAALEQAIKDDTSTSSSDLVDYHENLSVSLEMRYSCLKQPEDLQQANSHLRMALGLIHISRDL